MGYQPAIHERNRPAGKVAHATAKPQIQRRDAEHAEGEKTLNRETC